MIREVTFLELAKAASIEGNAKLVWFYIRQQARIMKKVKK